jgi:hypothetical protein
LSRVEVEITAALDDSGIERKTDAAWRLEGHIEIDRAEVALAKLNRRVQPNIFYSDPFPAGVKAISPPLVVEVFGGSSP